ncbi:MAG: TlpA disulfide reductase family protein [Nitrospirales bacterium]
MHKFFLMIRRVSLLSAILWIALITASCDSGYSGLSEVSSDNRPMNVKRGWPNIGAPSPPFTLGDLEGRQVSLSDFSGKVVLLNFWATWCGPCRVEMPAMEALYQEMKGKGLAIVAVSVDAQGTVVTRPFQEAMGLTFPILHDSDYEVGLSYGARTLPITYIIDRQGIIRHRVFGARDWNGAKAKELIQELLDPPKSDYDGLL